MYGHACECSSGGNVRHYVQRAAPLAPSGTWPELGDEKTDYRNGKQAMMAAWSNGKPLR